MVVRPEQWPATSVEGLTLPALGAAIAQILSQILLVTVLFAIGRGIGAIAGFLPILSPRSLSRRACPLPWRVALPLRIEAPTCCVFACPGRWRSSRLVPIALPFFPIQRTSGLLPKTGFRALPSRTCLTIIVPIVVTGFWLWPGR